MFAVLINVKIVYDSNYDIVLLHHFRVTVTCAKDFIYGFH